MNNKKLTFAYLFDNNFKNINDNDLCKIDVINYSFGRIIKNELSIDHLINLEYLIKKSHQHNKKIVLAIGGWGADGFSQVASSMESRNIFIQSIIKVLETHEFDGIDFDWEYPTTSVAKIHSSKEDKINFTLLIKELRETFDKDNKDLLITAAVGGGYYATRYYEVDKISNYVNYIHLMTYDLLNYSDTKTSHHTNLYPSINSVSSVDETVKAYIQLGANSQKLIVGIAFYGHIGIVDSSLNNGISEISQNISNSISYSNINNKYLNNSRFIRYFDDDAKASWLFDGSTFITYDDEISIAYKCEYVNKSNLGGVMFWEINHDSSGKLLDAIYKNLNK